MKNAVENAKGKVSDVLEEIKEFVSEKIGSSSANQATTIETETAPVNVVPAAPTASSEPEDSLFSKLGKALADVKEGATELSHKALDTNKDGKISQEELRDAAIKVKAAAMLVGTLAEKIGINVPDLGQKAEKADKKDDKKEDKKDDKDHKRKHEDDGHHHSSKKHKL